MNRVTRSARCMYDVDHYDVDHLHNSTRTRRRDHHLLQFLISQELHSRRFLPSTRFLLFRNGLELRHHPYDLHGCFTLLRSDHCTVVPYIHCLGIRPSYILTGPNMSMVAPLLELLPAVTSICIKVLSYKDPNATLIPFPMITSLTLTGTDFKSFMDFALVVSAFPLLEALIMHRVRWFNRYSSSQALTLPRSPSRLRILDLRTCHHRDILNWLMSHGENLSMNTMTLQFDSDIESFANFLPMIGHSLRHLCLSDNYGLNAGVQP
jgi:hypothetical protein